MKKYVDVKDIVNNEKYPFSLGQIRSLLTKRRKNGLYKCVRKIGKKIYIREDLFDEWIESHTELEDHKHEPKNIEDCTISIDELNLSSRTTNCLKAFGIKYLKSLTETTENELRSIKNMGIRSINEIKDKLASLGFLLKE